MGIAHDRIEAATIAAVLMIGFVAPPADAPILTGETIAKSEVDQLTDPLPDAMSPSGDLWVLQVLLSWIGPFNRIFFFVCHATDCLRRP